MTGATRLATKDRSFIIEGNPQGVRNGWFTWPIDFDPTWVEVCTGFEQK